MKKRRIGKYIIVGTFMILTGVVGVSAANTLTSNGVLYSNAVSSVTTVEGALNELYANYNSLLAKGNASASEILSGKKVLVKGKEVTGTMPDRTSNTGTSGLAWATSNIEITPYNQLRIGITPGYYGSANYSNFGTSGIVIDDFQNKLGITASKILSGQSIAGVSGTATSDATANASQILSGQTAYVNGNKITGTMANKSGTTVSATTITESGDNTLISIPTAGYYDTNSKISVANSILSSNLKTKIYELGTGTSFDIKALVPSIDYSQLTVDNFIVELSSVTVSVSSYYVDNAGSASNKASVSKSYNASTGILSVSNTSTSAYAKTWDNITGGIGTASVSFKVKLIV